jgi:hypothetical protein
MAIGETQADNHLLAKWGGALVAGWTAIPNAVIQNQRELGLDPVDFSLLVVLASYWWQEDRPARPGKTRLASTLGVSTTTIRRRIRRLEKRGFIERVYRPGPRGRNDTNLYLLDGLVKAASNWASVETQVNPQLVRGDQRRKKKES